MGRKRRGKAESKNRECMRKSDRRIKAKQRGNKEGWNYRTAGEGNRGRS